MNSTEEQKKLREKEIDECLDLHNCVSARDCTGTVTLNPETKEGIACENFRVFVKWALSLIHNNEKLTELFEIRNAGSRIG